MARLCLILLAAVAAGVVCLALFSKAFGAGETLAAMPSGSAPDAPPPPTSLVAPSRAPRAEVAVEHPAPLPSPDPEPPIFDGPPPDPVERGTCLLDLSLYDAWTHEPVASRVHLYRLAAPATEYWTYGDQVQAHVQVPAGGQVIAELPAGDYRAIVLAQRAGVPDSPPFRVAGDLSTVRIAVEPARRSSAYLALVDEQGAPIRHARMRREGTGFTATHVDADWIERRMCKVHYDRPLEAEVGHLYSHNRWVDVTAAEGGFDLGRFPEDDRERRHSSSVELAVEGHATVRCDIAGEHGADERHYVAVAPAVAPIVARFVLPDGVPAGGSNLVLRVETLARAAGEGADWRRSNVQVIVDDERFAPSVVSFRLDLGLAEQVLRRP